MFEYTGALHIHTRYSDGSGSLKTIIEAARRARADFIVISDHNNMRIREEAGAGWHDGILVIVGEEVSPRFNHYTAIGIQKEIPPDEMCAQRNIDAVTRQGGLGFVAHPFGRHRPCSASSWLDKLLKLEVTVYPWNDFAVEGFDGIEVWQYMYDWVKSVNCFNILAHLIAPNRFVTGPDAETMRMWDEANVSRKVVGIGTLDAHGKPSILRMFPACSYEYLLERSGRIFLRQSHSLGPARPTSRPSSTRCGRAAASLRTTSSATQRASGSTSSRKVQRIRWASDAR